MWREVERTYRQETVTAPDGTRSTQIKHSDVVRRELQAGDVGVFGGPELGSRFSVRVLDNDRLSVRATNNILKRLRLGVEDPASGNMEGRLDYYYSGVVDRKSVIFQLDQSPEHLVFEWYPEPEKPAVTTEIPPQGEVARPSVQTAVESRSLSPEQLELLRARALARLAGIKSGNLLPPEAGQAIAERQKYPTLPPALQVTPLIPEGQDPRPREYYRGSRGSTPPLPSHLQTRRMPGDYRPPDYHTGGPGPAGLPPWARPKGPFGG